MEKLVSELTDELVELKVKLQQRTDRYDAEEIKYQKKIKLLEYQIKLYEEQIETFNGSPDG